MFLNLNSNPKTMIKTIYTIQDIKTGRIFKMNHTAYQVAKKHGLDKNWEVMPVGTVKPSYLANNEEIIPTFDQDEEFADPFANIVDNQEDIEKPKRKYNKKQKNG